MTLIEVIVAAVLMGSVLTVAAALLVSTMSAWTRGIEKADAENGVLIAIRRISQHLEATDENSFVLFAANTGETPVSNPSWLTDLFGWPGSTVWTSNQVVTGNGAVWAPTSWIPTSGTGNGMTFLNPDPSQPMALDPKFGMPIWHHHDVWYLDVDNDPTSLTHQALYYEEAVLAHYADRYANGGSRIIAPDTYQLGTYVNAALPAALTQTRACSNNPGTVTLGGAPGCVGGTRVLKNVTQFVIFAPLRNSKQTNNYGVALPVWSNPVMIHLEVTTPHGNLHIDTSTTMRQNDDLQPAFVVNTAQQ